MKKVKKYGLRLPRMLPLSFLERETSFLGRQQLYVFVYYTAAIVLGLLTNLTGLTGPQQDFNLWLNVGYILVSVLFLTGYACRRTSLSLSLFGVIITTQVSTSVEMFYCAFTPDQYHMMLFVGNIVLLSVNILIALIAYLEYTPYILCALSMGTYIACMRLTENGILGNFFGIIFVIFVIMCILGNRLVRNMRSLDKENMALRKDEEELVNTLGLDREQLKAYMQLAQEKQNYDRTETLLDMLGENLRHALVANVREYLSVKETDMLEMEKLFPELSVSEREICLLILQGKQQRDICDILGKKESNISSTRTHIRRKLNMQPSDNLRKVLQERVGKKRYDNG